MGGQARWPRFGWAIVISLVLAACGGDDQARPDGTPESPPASPAVSPSGSPASTSPGADATQSPAASPGSTAGTEEPTVVLEPDTLAEVIITELVVRVEPRVAEDSQILEPVLTEGQRLFVVDGPHAESGYWWYLVQPIMARDASEALPFGWVASADRDGEPWLEAIDPECPSEPTVEAIAALSPEEQLVCFGDETLTITGEQQQCGASNVSIDPSWFQGGGCSYGPTPEAAVFVRFPPEVEGPSGTGAQEFTGHFDDQRAQECRWVGAEPRTPRLPEQAIVFCRTQFVVESAQPAS